MNSKPQIKRVVVTASVRKRSAALAATLPPSGAIKGARVLVNDNGWYLGTITMLRAGKVYVTFDNGTKGGYEWINKSIKLVGITRKRKTPYTASEVKTLTTRVKITPKERGVYKPSVVRKTPLAAIETSAIKDLMSDLKAKANVLPPMLSAIEAAVRAGLASKNPAAHSYAGAMEDAYRQYGLEGVKLQILYLLSNLRDWTGPEAKEYKKVLKRWSTRAEISHNFTSKPKGARHIEVSDDEPPEDIDKDEFNINVNPDVEFDADSSMDKEF